MKEGIEADATEILSKPFLDFEEIISLTISKKYDIENIDGDDKIKFEADLIADIIKAIDGGKIASVYFSKASSWRERYSCYTYPIKFNSLIVLALTLIFCLKYLYDKPEVKKIISEGCGHGDLFRLLIDILRYYIFYPALLMLVISIGIALKAFIDRLKIRTDLDRLKYLSDYVERRGLSKRLYDSETVIRFLNSRYSLGLETKNVSKSEVASENARAIRLKGKVIERAEKEIARELEKGCKCKYPDLATHVTPAVLKATNNYFDESRATKFLPPSEREAKVQKWCEPLAKEILLRKPETASRVRNVPGVKYMPPPHCEVPGHSTTKKSSQ